MKPKKFIWLSLFLLMFSISVKGNNELDSLYSIISASNVNDSDKIDAIDAVVWRIYGSQPDSAIQLCLTALKMSEEAHYSDREARACGWLGFMLEPKGDIQGALDYYDRNLRIRVANKDTINIAVAYANTGFIYMGQDQNEQALSCFLKCLSLNEAISNDFGIAGVSGNIGFLYNKMKRYSEATQYLRKSLELMKVFKNKNGQAYAILNLGVNLCRLDSIKMGINMLDTSLVYFESVKQKDGIAYALLKLSHWHFESKHTLVAETYARQGLDVATSIGHIETIKRAEEMLYKINRKKRNYKASLVHYERFIQMRDSINNETTQKATIRQQTKYEFEKVQLIQEQQKKDAQRIIEEETTRRDNLQYSIILITLLLVFGGVLSLGFIKVSPKVAEGLIFFSFLILFEFMLVLADPYIDKFSSGAPGYKLLFNAGLAGLIFPLHNYFEVMLKSKLTRNAKK